MASNLPSELEPIPTYRIDLSLPPRRRYVQLATDFAPRMRLITPLFDEILENLVSFAWLRGLMKIFASIFLRRVYFAEQTQELQGISEASGVDMYFLVALNLLLDSLLGCTSGGAAVSGQKRKRRKSEDGSSESSRILHFRTLDWGMDQLRSVLVVLEFVESQSQDPDKVIARSITYAGFVGVLTGVREDLSVSLNFRPTHSCSMISLRWHQILVLFSFRPSVAQILRSTLMLYPSTPSPGVFEKTISDLSIQSTAPCYLILCDGHRAGVVEKDLFRGKVRLSTDFIVHTNHDTKPTGNEEASHNQKEKSMILGMEALLEESEERRDCIQKKWDRIESRHKNKIRSGSAEPGTCPTVREETLKGWITEYPIMNECTHFGCILDPRSGVIRWLERGPEEVEEEEDEV